MVTYIECGCCGQFHQEGYYGECRNDSERFTIDQVEAKEKIGLADIVYQEDLEDIE